MNTQSQSLYILEQHSSSCSGMFNQNFVNLPPYNLIPGSLHYYYLCPAQLFFSISPSSFLFRACHQHEPSRSGIPSHLLITSISYILVYISPVCLLRLYVLTYCNTQLFILCSKYDTPSKCLQQHIMNTSTVAFSSAREALVNFNYFLPTTVASLLSWLKWNQILIPG